MKKYSKLKMFCLYCLSILVNILPLIIVLIVNWEFCTKTRRECLAISVTGVVWVGFLVFTMLGSMPRKLNRVFVLIAFYLMLELMKPLLSYMTIFAGSATIGALLDLFLVKPLIRRYTELRIATKTADLTTQQMEQVMTKILDERSGRV